MTGGYAPVYAEYAQRQENQNCYYCSEHFSILRSFYLMRNQTTICDVDYMRGMIPHQSIAILTSKRAHIKDPRIKKLADDIIDAQEEEIRITKELLDDLANKSKQKNIHTARLRS